MGYFGLHRCRTWSSRRSSADDSGISFPAACICQLWKEFRETANLVYRYENLQEQSGKLCERSGNDLGSENSCNNNGNDTDVYWISYNVFKRNLCSLHDFDGYLGVSYRIFCFRRKNLQSTNKSLTSVRTAL